MAKKQSLNFVALVLINMLISKCFLFFLDVFGVFLALFWTIVFKILQPTKLPLL